MDRKPRTSEIGQLRESHAGLEKALAALARELRNAREQQAATAEILRAISCTPTDARLVFDSIARHAVAICESLFANVFRFDGELLHYVASHQAEPGYVDMLRSKYPMPPDRSQVSGRVLLTGSLVRLEDARADPEYDQRFPAAMGWRRMLGVPMLRDGKVLGAIVVGWAEAGPVPAPQEELLKTFADQAVIAIENVRLFQTLQQRNSEIAKALEQQTATADILRVISSSPSDAGPVFETIVTSAARLCEANFAFVVLNREGRLTLAAHTTCTPEFAEFLKGGKAPDRATTTGRAALDRRPVQVLDFLAEPGVLVTPAHRAEGVRTVLAVPMLRDDRLLGVISIWRREVRAFSDNQVQLLETFASQAVIAIENVRLFGEIQDKNRQLELANTSKSRFLAAASHDLRQPLHALNLFVAQLRAESGPAERARLVARIDTAVSAMSELFDALLDMSRLDAGVLAPDRVVFPVAHLLERIETTFAEAAREKGLRLRVVPNGALVRSDFVLLERILLNLVSNAVRYTARGGVVIGCRRRGGRLRIDVWDSGAGIPEDQQRNVFGEFYQLAVAQSDRRGGLGLGLAIVDRLARLLDHPVELASRLHRGSRFSVSVPLAPPPQGPADVAAPEAPIADLASGKLVVVIDDDALVLEGMLGILRSWGCDVVTAGSAEVALARLAEQGGRPDLIVSDYHLANGETGIETIERLRRELGPAVPAFLVSGDTTPDRLRQAGACGYHMLHKPVSPMTLRAVLNRLLQGRGAAPGAERSARRRTIPPPVAGSAPADRPR